MKRLTRVDEDGTVLCIGCAEEEECNGDCLNCQHDIDAIEKLAEYEGLEEQGKLIRLPCKVGDTVYCFTPFCEICEETLDNEFSCEDCNKGSFVSENKFDYEMIRMFGRSIFRTKEEAEQALAKMKEV